MGTRAAEPTLPATPETTAAAITAVRSLLRALAAGDVVMLTGLLPIDARRVRRGPDPDDRLDRRLLAELGISGPRADVIAGGLPGSLTTSESWGYYFRFRFDQPDGSSFTLQAQPEDGEWRVVPARWMQPIGRKARIRAPFVQRTTPVAVRLPSE